MVELYRVRTASKVWREWGPYLSYRQWGTVREDYSPDGACWEHFSHDHARSRAYRWGEDGLFGICDINCILCFSPAFWNHTDTILKERFFGVTGNEGNNGEDVKEDYYHLCALPSNSYLKYLYRYPQAPYPYDRIMRENRSRSRGELEFEIYDSGVFDRGEYFDITVEYFKNNPRDILIQIEVTNRSSCPAPITVIPNLWFRNTWSWGRVGDDYPVKPRLHLSSTGAIRTSHVNLSNFSLCSLENNEALFTENETNYERLFGLKNSSPYVKDSFHRAIINKEFSAINPYNTGTKACFVSKKILGASESFTFKYRLLETVKEKEATIKADFDQIVQNKRQEANKFYSSFTPDNLTEKETEVYKQAYSGLISTKQFYYYSVKEWREGDPGHPPPAPSRKNVRNTEWDHLFNKDILSMPDKWEYPWYAAWDTAFHMIPMAKIDPVFTKHQLLLFLRDWYMHPNGQIPAYEFAFSDVNPPVHAWACWRVYKMTAAQGQRDREFLARSFHKLVVNFTWWVNRKDPQGNNLFSGGFLGLDNIGVFDRSSGLSEEQILEQADATSWMAFYCSTMLSMALELASQDSSYSDLASKFFEHFVAISDAINNFRGTGLWNDSDGFYYDQLLSRDSVHHLRVRSLVGIIPLIAVSVLDESQIYHLPDFKRRMRWFYSHRSDLVRNIAFRRGGDNPDRQMRLLSIPSRERLERMLARVFSEDEFLSPYGIRSLSKFHEKNPYELNTPQGILSVDYNPAESNTCMFGGNSNWRGPIWFPINFLIVEALERYHHFYGDDLLIEYPTGSGIKMNLLDISRDISFRLTRLFISQETPTYLSAKEKELGPSFYNNLYRFNEFFHGDTGRGLGANHQTGWTALVTQCLENIAHSRESGKLD